MRRRIVTLLLPVLGLLVVGVVVFVGVLVSDRNTQAVYVDRMGDATRFASMVAGAIESGDSTRVVAELEAYTALFSSPVWVLALDRQLMHDPGSALPATPEFEEALDRAFAGDREAQASTVWPWTARPLHVLEPVGRDSQVTAVVVIEAPTDRLRQDAWRTWAVGSGVLLLPLSGLVLGMWPMTRWILRPVRELESVAATVRAGDLDARADVEHGPPELRELATSFNAMVSTVQRTLRRQRDFVSDAAHQLRNPLASLRLTVESLQPWLREEAARETYEDAVEETERMSGMFEAMLAATAMAGAEPVAADRAQQVAALLAAGRPRWEAVLAGAGMALQVEPVDPALVLREPAGGLPGLIDELVANAARLSHGDRLTISVRPGDRYAELAVADDGVGLDAADREAATGRFWRANRHQNVPGTGLGLAILADVVADVGGSLTLQPNHPRGLRVVVRLPVVRGALRA